MKKLLIFASLAILSIGCNATRIYKVTFESGDYEYYELKYKPKSTDKSIHYQGEEILGVKKIELVQ